MVVLIIAFYLILGAGYLLLCRLWCKWLWARLEEWEKNKGSGDTANRGSHDPNPLYTPPPTKRAQPQFAARWDRKVTNHLDNDGSMYQRHAGFECSWCKKLSFVPADECPHCGAQMRNAGVW